MNLDVLSLPSPCPEWASEERSMTRQPIDEDWLIDRLDEFWPAHTAAFTRLLIALRQHFDEDLDSVILIGAISTGMRGDGWKTILLDGQGAQEPGYSPTNTQSIAQATGIARETVRRKLSQLQAKGWVRRDTKGNWIPTGQAAKDLRPATLATIAYLQTVFKASLQDSKDGAKD